MREGDRKSTLRLLNAAGVLYRLRPGLAVNRQSAEGDGFEIGIKQNRL